ncbi:hypothetical protein FHX48_001003 [Microbacterium halimionae]|uniref:Uridine kinase n=2 Tax=Microbacterium halimionae TaxID=1526413 RepID=A0A7W3JN86_9MICO|nr:hypothetical protein [Microbacterium halimionae]NII96133.1 hypothetical protein [Microbacterium halimionae]
MQLIALDDIYPGWDGLDDGVAYVRQHVLEPHARGEVARWQRWDWERDCRAEHSEVDPDRSLVIEGSGIITELTMPFASVAVWLDAPDLARKQRALGRDGDTYSPHWERWAAQEEAHILRDQPSARATLRFDLP